MLFVCTLFNNTNKECVDNACLLFNPLNTELNPICYLMALLGAHIILHVSRIRVNAAFDKCSLTDVIWNHTAAKLIVSGAMTNRRCAFHYNKGHSFPS
jgi:hypothetical protein